jgi:hypothetical protein
MGEFSSSDQYKLEIVLDEEDSFAFSIFLFNCNFLVHCS